MNQRESATVLALLSTAWPWLDMAENTARVWQHELASVHPDDGLAAARMLIRTSQHFPSIAEYLDTTKGFARRRQEETDAVGQLEQGPRTDEERANVRRLVATMRGVLSSSVAQHRHFPPVPCPVRLCAYNQRIAT